MKLYSLQRRQFIPASRARVFAFFSKPENLSFLTPPGLGFHILTPIPDKMKEGALIDYTIRVAGLPVRWTTIVTHFDPPARFVDVQLKGPYSYWHHTHEFTAVNGGTQMTDTVHYGVPTGIFGKFIRELFIKQQLERIFDYRADRLKQIVPIVENAARSRQKSHTRSDKQ